VQCYVCLKELDGWEKEDDPWEEHRRHTSKKGWKCAFVDLGKNEQDMTVEEFFNLIKARSINKITVAVEQRVEAFRQKAEEVTEKIKALSVEEQ